MACADEAEEEEVRLTTRHGRLPIMSRPLSESDIKALRPFLNTMAGQFSRCEADRDDYIQQAYVALLQKEWISPITCAFTAMQDYARYRSHREEVLLFAAGEGDGEFDFASTASTVEDLIVNGEMQEFRGLGLSDKDRRIAVLLLVEGMKQSDVAVVVGISQTSVSNALKRIKKAVSAKWIKN
jgi:DNA-directed RNA polymerase specialized sigma subunit